MRRFQQLVVTGIAIFSVYNVQAQTLFSYGNKTVSKAEFLKAYNKNNAETKPTAQSYRDYLDLYIKFKLKVQAAFDARLDTLATQQAELKSFRSQVSSSYMNDEASTNVLIDEAITRSAKDIQVSHIYVQIFPNESPELQKKASDKINLAYSRLQKGEDFGKVATSLSDDTTARTNKGNIGYITSFVLPYEMESVIYATPVGKFSKPLKTKIGYHIFKNNAERPAAGRVRVAQILIAYPPDASPAQKQEAAIRADSLYKALLRGADFKKAAYEYSADNLSYQAGGELQEFGPGRYDPEFEKAVFALKTDGAISKPVATSNGLHIIKRLELKPVAVDKKNKTVWENYRQQVVQSDRMDVSKKILLKKVLQQTSFKRLPYDQKLLNRLTDSILENKEIATVKEINTATPLFSFKQQTVTVNDWINYLQSVRGMTNLSAGKTHEQLMDQFIENAALEYYREHLEEYNTEFAYQLDEFREGNLLFEVMQRKIWEAASADSVGLKKYYDTHKNNYWWESSADAWIITAANDSVARAQIQKVSGQANTGINWRTIIDKSEGGLQGDSGRFELGQLPVIDRTNFTEGLITAPVKNETDNSVTFCYVIKLYPKREQRGFNDARGFVINDYQSFLEEQWISDLKKKYPVKVNEEVMKQIIAGK